MYTAINIDVFVAAYSGALGGFINQQRTILRDSAEYARLCQQALAFAEEFDTLYAAVLPNILQLANIESATSEYFNGYSPPGGVLSVTASHYVESAQNIINLLTAADTNVAANVTNTIPQPGGGGGGTLAGDVTGPLLTNIVVGLTGVLLTVAMHGNNILWDAGSVPLVGQSGQTSDVPTHDFKILAQAPFAGASGTNRTPGSVVAEIGTPAAGGDNGFFKVRVAGNIEASIGQYPGVASLGSIWLGGVTPTATNFTIAADGTTQVSINAGAGGVYIGIANGNTAAFFTDRLGFFHGQTGLIQVETQTSDIPTVNLILSGQAPFAGSSGANRTPGNVIASIPPPDGAGTAGFFKVKIGANIQMDVGEFPGFPQYGVIWLGQVTPNAANYALLSDGADAFVNATNATRFSINGSPRITVSTSTALFFVDVTAGAANLDINAFRGIGGLTGFIYFSAGATNPTIYQATQTSDTPTFELVMTSQAAFAGASGTNRNSGGLRLGSGAPAAGGIAGDINVYLGAIQAARFKSLASVGGGVFTVFDHQLATDSIIAVHADDDSPYLVRYYNDTFGAATPIMSYYGTSTGSWEFVLEAAGKEMKFSTSGFNNVRMKLKDSAMMTSVGIGVGTAFSADPAANQIFVNSGTSPADPQIKIQTNLLGAMTMHCFAADNEFLTFDSEFTGGSFIARGTSASLLYKTGGALHVYGNGGLTPGVGFSPTDRWSWNLATGNVTMLAPQFIFGAAVVTPIIYVADQTTNAVDGTSLTVSAQNSTGTGTRGGSLFLKAGTGTSIQGQIFMYGSLNLSGTDGNPRIFISGATISFEAGQTPFFIQEDLTTNAGTGHLMTIRAQNETGTTSTGGTLLLASGTGTTAAGDVRISPLGSTSTTYFVFTHISTALQLTASATATSINIVASGTQLIAIQALGANSSIYNDATTHHWRTEAGGDVMLLTSNGTNTFMTFALDTNVVIQQAVSAPTVSAPQFIIRAATGGAGGGAGGDLVLQAGEGQGAADGSVLFYPGLNLAMALASSELDFLNGMGTIIFQNSVTSDILVQHGSIGGVAGKNFKIEAQSVSSGTFAGGYMLLGGGADNGPSLAGGVRLYIDGSPTAGILLEMGEVIAGKRVVTLLRGTVLTTTQMPANTGDRVMYFADCATAPTAPGVSGVIPFSEGGQWKYMDTSGTVVTI